MKNICWCPCLKVRVNFLPRRNYAAHFTVQLTGEEPGGSFFLLEMVAYILGGATTVGVSLAARRVLGRVWGGSGAG